MRRSSTHVAAAVLFIIFSACLQVHRFNHQPTMAGSKAQQFADAAFVRRNLPTAYQLLSQDMRKQLTIEDFGVLVSQMHPGESPSAVKATEYEPLLGQKGMNIYLTGNAREERFYYRIYMEGSKETDYLVAGLWRNKDPYPPSNMRKPLS